MKEELVDEPLVRCMDESHAYPWSQKEQPLKQSRRLDCVAVAETMKSLLDTRAHRR